MAAVGTGATPITTVLSGATKLLRPAWDFQRLWVVDRTADGAQVLGLYLNEGMVPTPVTIDGITGRQVAGLQPLPATAPGWVVRCLRDQCRRVSCRSAGSGRTLVAWSAPPRLGHSPGAAATPSGSWTSAGAPWTTWVPHAQIPASPPVRLGVGRRRRGTAAARSRVLQNVATRVCRPAEREPGYAIGVTSRTTPDRGRLPCRRPSARSSTSAELTGADATGLVPAPRSCCDRGVLGGPGGRDRRPAARAGCVGRDWPGRLLCRRCADAAAEPARSPGPPRSRRARHAVDGGRVRRRRSGPGARPQGASHARSARTPRGCSRGRSPRAWRTAAWRRSPRSGAGTVPARDRAGAGHDPTWTITRGAARLLRHAAYDADALRRLHFRASVADQSGLDAAARAANLEGSMCCPAVPLRRLARRRPQALLGRLRRRAHDRARPRGSAALEASGLRWSRSRRLRRPEARVIFGRWTEPFLSGAWLTS